MSTYEKSLDYKNEIALGQALYEMLILKDPDMDDVAWNELEPMQQELYKYLAKHVIIRALEMKIVVMPPQSP